MTAEELEQVKEMVLRDLPRVLESDPRFVVFVEGIISEKFPRRDEFARLLDEFQAMRGEMAQRFEAMQREMTARFEAVDRRFTAGDQRFDSVDQRLDKVEQRLDNVDQRLDNVDQRLEQVDQRLDTMDQRFEALTNEVRGLRHWMHMNVGGLQGRIGKRMEDVVAGAFCYGLERADIKPENVKLRQKITDPEGVVFRPGREREVDIIALDREIIVFEVKAAADPDDVESFADKLELVRHQNPNVKVDGVFVSLGADARVRRRCAEKGLRLIP